MHFSSSVKPLTSLNSTLGNNLLKKFTRLEALNDSKKNKIIVTNLMGYLRFLPPKEVFLSKYVNLKIGDNIDIKQLEKNLYEIGYTKETIVDKTGTIATRGIPKSLADFK